MFKNRAVGGKNGGSGGGSGGVAPVASSKVPWRKKKKKGKRQSMLEVRKAINSAGTVWAIM